jgi:hypothetical protein
MQSSSGNGGGSVNGGGDEYYTGAGDDGSTRRTDKTEAANDYDDGAVFRRDRNDSMLNTNGRSTLLQMCWLQKWDAAKVLIENGESVHACDNVSIQLHKGPLAIFVATFSLLLKPARLKSIILSGWRISAADSL